MIETFLPSPIPQAEALEIPALLAQDEFTGLIRAAVFLIVGFPVVLILSRWLRAWATEKYSPQQGMVAGKLLFYLGAVLVLVSVMAELGFSLTPLLGAAGIVGIALGFASQTSVSNIISGFFLIAEQPFVVDDLILVGGTTGRVMSIDMMSVKLRTFDNRFVRIPNETLVKSEVITVTRFPIRRLDLPVGVAYKEDIERVRKVLLDVADRNPLCLIEPEPMVRFEGFGDSSINLLLAVWTVKENFITLRNRLQEEVKARLDEEGIEIPFPHRTLYTGLATEPFPVRVVEESSELGGAPPGNPSPEPGR